MAEETDSVTEWSMDMTAREIAGLFVSKGWRYGKAPFPKPDDVAEVLQVMVDHLRTTGAGYIELGRFVVYRDTDFPDSFEVSIKVGYVSDKKRAGQDDANPEDTWGQELF